MRKKDDNNFYAGYLIACANIVHLMRDTHVASQVIRESGITWKEVVELDLTDYDLDVLKVIRRKYRETFNGDK